MCLVRALLLWLCATTAHAAMVLGQTRVVASPASPKTVITLRNADRQPLLVQAWVDGGRARARPSASAEDDTPFVLDPPVMRIEPGQTRALAVLLVDTPASLAADRESLFWLNVLEVAASAEPQADEARLDVRVLSRLKLFYRPPIAAARAPRLQFHWQRADTALWLSIYNPTPIHQTLAHLRLRAGTAAVELDAPMVPPFTRQRVRVPARAAGQRWTLDFAVLDDEGNRIHAENPMERAP